MGGRAWSQEELIQLEELTETYPLATVARKLNRSENAVFLKRQRTGIGGFMANTDMLTRNTLSRILGVENRTIQYWERKGLKSVRKKPYVMYRQQDIIRYMKEHPEDWNAARVTDDTLFMQYPWFKEKRKNDISHKYNWTQTEVSQMKMLRKQGFTIREIAEKMNRSESSIKYKLYGREKNIPKGHPEWSLVKCPICGQECWRPMSRQELRQKKMQAACTECGLKIESRRNQP